MNGVERLDVRDRAVQREPLVGGAHPVDRDQPRLVMAVMRLHHEMGHAARDRVDDDVREFAERPVRACNDTAELELHTDDQSSRRDAATSCATGEKAAHSDQKTGTSNTATTPNSTSIGSPSFQ